MDKLSPIQTHLRKPTCLPCSMSEAARSSPGASQSRVPKRPRRASSRLQAMMFAVRGECAQFEPTNTDNTRRARNLSKAATRRRRLRRAVTTSVTINNQSSQELSFFDGRFARQRAPSLRRPSRIFFLTAQSRVPPSAPLRGARVPCPAPLTAAHAGFRRALHPSESVLVFASRS